MEAITSRLNAAGLILLLLLAGCGPASPTPNATPIGATNGSWILEIEAPGPQWLDAAWFRAHDLDSVPPPDRIQLFLGEQSVPYLRLEGPDGPGLFFFAQAAPSRYAPWAAYRLEIGQGAGQTMATAPLPDAATAGAVQDTAWTTLWRERDRRYMPQVRAPEPWLWEPVFSGGRLTHTLTLTEAVSGPITLTARLWTQKRLPGTSPNLPIWWDGDQVGEWRGDGPAEQSWKAALPETDPGDVHTLVVQVPAPEKDMVSKFWLDGWGIAFRRPLVMEMPGVTWTAEARKAIIAGGKSDDRRRLLDVTDPAAPVDLGVVSDDQAPTEPGHRYWLGVPWRAPAPERTRPRTTVDRASLDQIDYLIIAPEPFWEALQPLIEHRRNEGLTVSRLTPTQVYDAFGDSRPDPEAIRALVQQLHEQGQLRYLLLVGDASVHLDGYAGEQGALRVITSLAPTTYLHETPSDQAMISDRAGQPLVAVGRFPAETAAQVKTIVDKTILWEQTGLASALILSDDQPSFGQFADEMAPLLPVESQRLDAAQDDARPRVLEALEEEGAWLNYVGHGSLALWGDEKVLQREDEWSQPAIVTVWACLSGYFVHPEQDSLAEVWLRSTQGGAAAFVGPTGETYLNQQQPLARVFYQEVQKGKPIGDALLSAWQAATDAEADAARSYLLLGDPALRIDVPDNEQSSRP